MPRTRRTVAVLCLALVAFAALVPAAVVVPVYAILVPLWFVAPVLTVEIVRRRSDRCADQPLALRASIPPRAPPAPALG